MSDQQSARPTSPLAGEYIDFRDNAFSIGSEKLTSDGGEWLLWDSHPTDDDLRPAGESQENWSCAIASQRR